MVTPVKKTRSAADRLIAARVGKPAKRAKAEKKPRPPKRKRQPRPSVPTRWLALSLGLPLGLLGAVIFAGLTVLMPELYNEFVGDNAEAAALFGREGISRLRDLVQVAFAFATAVLMLSFFCCFRRREGVLKLFRFAAGCGYVVAALYAFAVWRVTELLFSNEIPVFGGMELNRIWLFHWRWQLLWPLAVALPVLILVHVLTWKARVIYWYSGSCEENPAPGDRVLEDLRTHGDDPVFRKSAYGSMFLHFFIIILLPWIAGFFGCVEDYRVPKGSGDPVVALVQIVQPQKKPKKRYILRPDSIISFRIPDLNDSEVMEQVDKVTQVTYTADLAARAGKMGAGGGDKGGWPEGMEDAIVRFIRLQYSGRDWDDGMDERSRADINFLQEFHKLTGFKVAARSESHPITHLRKYNKGYAPPFVYMTGSGSINIPQRDIRTLREYLMDGGMLLADCGSPHWDRNFRALASQLMPGNSLVVIADDDPIFQMPFHFPNGAPPLWHHGGKRALGIKHQGRWVVFYHPGDLKDAWKTGQHGLRPELAKAAMHLGVNIVYYSFTNYLRLTEKYRR